jgi:hypothetical protein
MKNKALSTACTLLAAATPGKRTIIPYLGLFLAAVFVSLLLFAQSDLLSVSSSPPDLTSYFRGLVAGDNIPLDLEEYSGVFQTPTVVDVIVNNTDATLTNTDTFSDSEPSIAVNPLNANEIVITGFSGSWGTNSPLFHSTDGGNTWTKSFTIPRPPGIPSAIGCPCDQTPDYARGNRLSGAFLSFGPTDVYSGTTTNPANSASWNWLVTAGVTQRTNDGIGVGNVDQPWLLVNRDPVNAAQDNVYVAYDNFNGAPDMRVAAAAGTNPPNFTVQGLSGFSTGFVNPGHRLAVDPRNGAVYSLFQRRLAAGAGGSQNVNYMLNRSLDGGNTWILNGSGTGIIVANADSNQPVPKFGGVNALLGGVDHAAVDPNSDDVYYVYGNRDAATGNNRIAIRRLQTVAGNIAIGAEHFVTGQVQAAIPSVAVANNGVVGVFFYTFNGPSSGFPQFSAHLSLSQDGGMTFADRTLETFLSPANDNGNPRQRVLGDYVQLKASGRFFYGVFTGNGVPFGRTVSNTDPIFYKQSANRPPTANAGSDRTVNADANCEAVVTLDGTKSSDPDGDPLTYLWTGPFGTATGPTPTVTLPLGVNVITLKVTDSFGASATATVTITVVDVTPPTVGPVTATPNVLWPVNHKFVSVTITYTATDNCNIPVCTLAVSSNQPVNGIGDGNTSPDWQVIDAHHVLLRAERTGTDADRIYTVTITCKDAAGNPTVKTVAVTVPHDQSH